MQKDMKSFDDRIADLYYTASEARAVLGMSKDMFNYWVKTGKIKKRVFMGKHGFYAKKDINLLASRIEAMMFADMPEPLTFRRGTVDDLESETYLAYLIFGSRALDQDMRDARRAYLERCPDSDWQLYDNERLVAYINLIAVSDRAVALFKTGKYHAWSFSQELMRYTPGRQHKCLIADFVTIPSAPPARRSAYAERVLLELGHVLKDFGARGVEITHLYAASSTASGVRILTRAGFSRQDTEVKDRYVYELDLSTASHIKMLADYREALSEWHATRASATPTVPSASILPLPFPQESRPAPRVSEGQIQALPAGYVLLGQFYHGIPETTVFRLRSTGHLPVTSGNWRDEHGHAGKYALSPEQQRAFYESMHVRPGFTPCPNCPHDDA